MLGQLCGATAAADRRTFFITDSVTAALFCSVSTLDIQLRPWGRVYLPVPSKNPGRTHSSWHTPLSINMTRFQPDSQTVPSEGQPSQVIHPAESEVKWEYFGGPVQKLASERRRNASFFFKICLVVIEKITVTVLLYCLFEAVWGSFNLQMFGREKKNYSINNNTGWKIPLMA